MTVALAVHANSLQLTASSSKVALARRTASLRLRSQQRRQRPRHFTVCKCAVLRSTCRIAEGTNLQLLAAKVNVSFSLQDIVAR